MYWRPITLYVGVSSDYLTDEGEHSEEDGWEQLETKLVKQFRGMSSGDMDFETDGWQGSPITLTHPVSYPHKFR